MTRGNDYMVGGPGNDSLDGGYGNDTLIGEAGNDLLDGGFGFDLIDGGSGIDTVTYSFYSGPIVADLSTNQVSFPGNSTLVDTLSSIENVIGGSGNDTIIGNSADNNLYGGAGHDTIEGLGDDDTLIGGTGSDTLAGGTGTNHLSGGEGSDNFVTESGGIQIIEDFERGTDKIDITTSGAQEISLAPNNGNTNVINQSNTTLATIQGQTLTTEDLILISDSEKQSLFPTLNVSEQNITGLIKEWGDKFAQQQGSSIAGDIDMSGVNFRLTNLDYQQSVEIPSTAISVSNIWRNTTGNSGNQSIEVNNEKTLERTITTENQISISQTNGVSTNSNFSVSSSVTASAKVSIGVYEGGVEATVAASVEYGITQDFENTFERVLNQSRSLSESTTSGITQTQEIPVSPQTVLYNDIITYNGTSNVPIIMSYSVDGDFEFSLDNGNSYTVPINAILQHYDLLDGQLDTFQPAETANLKGRDFDGNGTSLFYAETLNFDLVGSLELESTFSQTTTSSVTDVLLNGSLVNGNSLAGLEIIRDELGAPVQVRYTANAEDERLWIVKDSLTSNMEYDMVTGFGPGNDKIAISHNQIDAIDDLNISYSGGNADIYFGDQHLARLNGIDANSLDSSDFVFSTQGTVFDESITNM